MVSKFYYTAFNKKTSPYLIAPKLTSAIWLIFKICSPSDSSVIAQRNDY